MPRGRTFAAALGGRRRCLLAAGGISSSSHFLKMPLDLLGKVLGARPPPARSSPARLLGLLCQDVASAAAATAAEAMKKRRRFYCGCGGGGGNERQLRVAVLIGSL
jgi:hypothetical protein